MNTTNTTKRAAGTSGISTVVVSVLALVAAIGFLAAAAYIGTMSKTGATQMQNAQAENSQTASQVTFTGGGSSIAADDNVQDSWVTKFRLARNAISQNVQDSWLTRFRLAQASGENVQDSWLIKFRLAQAANADVNRASGKPVSSAGSKNLSCSVLTDLNQRARCLGVR